MANAQPALIRAMQVWEALSENGFRGKTITALSYEFDLPKSTCWRILSTFEEGGWAVRKTGGHRQEDLWQISPGFLEILAKYKQYMLGRRERISTEYKTITGEALDA